MFLSLFGSFTKLSLPPSIVALQDPPVYRGKLPSFNLFTVFSPQTDGGCKPRVAFYVDSSFLATVSLLPRFFGRGDVMALDLFTPDDFFNPSMTGFTIINSYSTKGRPNNTRSFPRILSSLSLPSPRSHWATSTCTTPRQIPSGSSKRTRSPPRPPTLTGPRNWGSPSLMSLVFILSFLCALLGAPASLTSPLLVPSEPPTFQNGPNPSPPPVPTTFLYSSALKPPCFAPPPRPATET